MYDIISSHFVPSNIHLRKNKAYNNVFTKKKKKVYNNDSNDWCYRSKLMVELIKLYIPHKCGHVDVIKYLLQNGRYTLFKKNNTGKWKIFSWSVYSYWHKLTEPFHLDLLLNCMHPHATANGFKTLLMFLYYKFW